MALEGCAPGLPLAEVPIEGGSVEQQAAAADTLAHFEQWVGQGRVTLNDVRFEPLDQTSENATLRGQYLVHRRVIELSDTLEPNEVPAILSHELGHAIDYQEDLAGTSGDLLRSEALRIAADTSDPLHEDIARLRTDRLKSSELLAMLTEQFPLGTNMLAHPCEGEPTSFLTASDWVNSEVWSGEPDVTSDDPNSSVQGSVEIAAPFSVDEIEAVGSSATDAVVLIMGQKGAYTDVWVSTTTGAETGPFSDFTWSEVTDGYDVEGPIGAPEIGDFRQQVVAPIEAVTVEGNTVRLVNAFTPRGFGLVLMPRLLVTAGSQWFMMDQVCPSEISSVFAANAGLYLVSADGVDVAWSRIQ